MGYQASPYLGASSNNSSTSNTPLCMPYTSHMQSGNNLYGAPVMGMGGMMNAPSHSNSPFLGGNDNPYYMNGNTPKFQGNGTTLNAQASNFMLPPSISNTGTTASNFVSSMDSQGRSLHFNSGQYLSPYFGSISSTSSFSNGNSVESTPVFSSRDWREVEVVRANNQSPCRKIITKKINTTKK